MPVLVLDGPCFVFDRQCGIGPESNVRSRLK